MAIGSPQSTKKTAPKKTTPNSPRKSAAPRAPLSQAQPVAEEDDLFAAGSSFDNPASVAPKTNLKKFASQSRRPKPQRKKKTLRRSGDDDHVHRTRAFGTQMDFDDDEHWYETVINGGPLIGIGIFAVGLLVISFGLFLLQNFEMEDVSVKGYIKISGWIFGTGGLMVLASLVGISYSLINPKLRRRHNPTVSLICLLCVPLVSAIFGVSVWWWNNPNYAASSAEKTGGSTLEHFADPEFEKSISPDSKATNENSLAAAEDSSTENSESADVANTKADSTSMDSNKAAESELDDAASTVVTANELDAESNVETKNAVPPPALPGITNMTYPIYGPSGASVIACKQNGGIWDLDKFKELGELKIEELSGSRDHHRHPYSPSGRYMFGRVKGDHEKIIFHDLVTQEDVCSFSTQEIKYQSRLAMQIVDEQFAAMVGFRGDAESPDSFVVQKIDFINKEIHDEARLKIKSKASISTTCIAFSDGPNSIVAIQSDRRLSVFEVATGKLLVSLVAPPHFQDMFTSKRHFCAKNSKLRDSYATFSKDGTQLAVALTEVPNHNERRNSIVVWDVKSGEIVDEINLNVKDAIRDKDRNITMRSLRWAPDEQSFIVNEKFLIDRASKQWVATSTADTNYLSNGDLLGHFGDANLKGGRCRFPRKEIDALLAEAVGEEAIAPMLLHQWFKNQLESSASAAAE